MNNGFHILLLTTLYSLMLMTGCDTNNTETTAATAEQNTTPHQTSSTEQATAVTPALTVKEIMVGTIEPASNAIWAIGLDENIPQTEEAWKNVELHALRLLHATATIAQGGAGPRDMEWAKQDNWQVLTQEMERITNDILAAAKKRDYDATLEASNYLVDPCGVCHTAFPADSSL